MNKIEKIVKTKGINGLTDQEISQLLNVQRPHVEELVIEYARRKHQKRIWEQERQQKIPSSVEAYEYITPFLMGLEVEHFYCLYMRRNNSIISIRKIGEGGINACTVDARIILKHAILLGATALILAHNHPRGTKKPSESDIKLTRQIKESAKIMEIMVMDHLIYTDNGYYSFADEGQI